MVCVEISTLLFIYVQAGAWLLYPATAVLVTVFGTERKSKPKSRQNRKERGKKEQKKGNEATEQERVSAMDRT